MINKVESSLKDKQLGDEDDEQGDFAHRARGLGKHAQLICGARILGAQDHISLFLGNATVLEVNHKVLQKDYRVSN